MASLFPLAMLFNLVSFTASNPVTPPDPIITQAARLRRRSDTDSFIGYFSDSSGIYYPSYCPEDYAYVISSYYAQCWPTTYSGWESSAVDFMYTSCFDSTLYAYSYDYVCSDGCSSESIFPFSTSDGNYFVQFDCKRSITNELWREVSADADIRSDFQTTSSSTSSSSITASPRSSSSGLASQTSTLTPTVSPTPESATPKEASKAWIAGVVVGAVALIAIAGLIFYLMRQRKKSKEQSYQVAPQMQSAYAGPHQSFAEGYLSPPPNAMSPNHSVYQSQDAKGYYGQAVNDNRLSQNPNGDPNANTFSVYSHFAPPTNGSQTQINSEGSAQMPAVGTASQELPALASPTTK